MARGGKIIIGLAALAALGLGTFWVLSEPRAIAQSDLPQHVADVANGERLYHAAGCISCHKAGPDVVGAEGLPAGGTPFKTPIGTFYPPNLTPDAETGLGGWTDVQFVNAVQRGLSPEGEHLVPAFPYTSYAHMKTEDVLDIRAYLNSLPAINAPEKRPDLPFEPLLRRAIGIWKLMGLDPTPIAPVAAQTESWNRGAYLVNSAGHCNECHTPRGLFMLPDWTHKFAGGPHPDGQGKVPSLLDLVGRKKYIDAADLSMAFANGEIMGYEDMASGGMGDVQSNLSKLPQSDIDAVAEYVASLK
jgi:mono/diheme cytochrome c family protein